MTRAMIVVAAGTGSRFEQDKMLTPVAGIPLVAITVTRVRAQVDRCVLVCRQDQIEPITNLGLDVVICAGGPDRTASEIAGLSALDDTPDLIGVHDGARPNIGAALIERLFDAAGEVGGAIPVVPMAQPLLDRVTLRPVPGVMAAQTPQIFRGPLLRDRYREASRTGFSGQDTFEVVTRFGAVTVAAVPGDEDNIKVTYPTDLARVTPLSATAGNGSH